MSPSKPPVKPSLRAPIRALLGAVLLASSAAALAWGTEGHQVIAVLAEKQLTPAARTEVNRLLALEPGSTLASISTWADEHRTPQTASWHYVNFPRDDCSYQPERDCPDGRCVVGAIERQVRVLGSQAPDAQKLTALKYVVHFVGDVHQPLHAGYQDDRGGNQYQLQAFGRGTNLHAVWDSGLISALGEDAEAMAAHLANKATGKSGTWTAAQAAKESCLIVGTPGFYPGRRLDQAYLERYNPVMEDRLALAGARLAEVLNRVWK